MKPYAFFTMFGAAVIGSVLFGVYQLSKKDMYFDAECALSPHADCELAASVYQLIATKNKAPNKSEVQTFQVGDFQVSHNEDLDNAKFVVLINTPSGPLNLIQARMFRLSDDSLQFVVKKSDNDQALRSSLSKAIEESAAGHQSIKFNDYFLTAKMIKREEARKIVSEATKTEN